MIKYIASGTESGHPFPDVLHIGCGSDIMNGAVNVDTCVSDWIKQGLIALPPNCLVYEGLISGPQDFPKKHFKRVEAHMVLEHIHPDLIPNLLYCLSNFLQDNGVIIATVPNFYHLADMLVEITDKAEGGKLGLKDNSLFREVMNEFMCPSMAGMVPHQSIWTKPFAQMWLAAEGFSLISWEESKNKMHVAFKAVKKGGDHASPINMQCNP